MKKPGIITLLFVFFIFSAGLVYSQETADKEKKLRIDWEEVDGAVEYRVRIADAKSKIVLNETVEPNYIEFFLPPGKYRITVGTVNKFYKIDSWSDWADFEIARPKEPEKEESSKKISRFRIGIGMPYFQVISGWKDLYDNSYTGAALNAGFMADGLGFLRRFRAFNYIGIELDACYIQFKGKEAFNRIKSNLNSIITGGNLIAATDFNFPVNVIARGGGGIVFTEQVYKKYDTAGEEIATGKYQSSDPFLKAGLSLEVKIISDFYIEAGADYYSIFFLVNRFESIRYFCLLGIRL